MCICYFQICDTILHDGNRNTPLNGMYSFTFFRLHGIMIVSIILVLKMLAEFEYSLQEISLVKIPTEKNT